MKWTAIALVAGVTLSGSILAADETVSEFVLPGGVAIRIVEAPFDAAIHHIKGCSGGPDGCVIDGKLSFGSDNALPKSYVKSIVASISGHSYSLDSTQMYDAWGDRPFKLEGGVQYFGGRCRDDMNCSFRGLFSDMGGGFVAEWRVQSGVSQRTVLTGSSDVISTFLSNIDPPEI